MNAPELAGDLPLHAGREAGAAAAAQAGGLDVRKDREAVPLQGVGQGLVAVAGDVFPDVFRIDETAVAERDAHLLAVEVHVLGVADMGSRAGILVQQALDLFAADDMGRDDFPDVGRADGSIERVVRDDLHDGAFLAEPEAAGDDHFDAVGDAVCLELVVELLDDLRAFGGFAAGTAAAEDLHVGRTLLQARGGR